ncbi:hypothetical protein QBC35DRAFT_242969 [Podospora australis]|uniref:Uncharacterized protein n=1 Tax=Podospora australis TaxID=1536484 RepID=A0AAN6X179_9PEZI|nr:hypothetical protein QBC35DRAFT_242969 [Podospora australis]
MAALLKKWGRGTTAERKTGGEQEGQKKNKKTEEKEAEQVVRVGGTGTTGFPRGKGGSSGMGIPGGGESQKTKIPLGRWFDIYHLQDGDERLTTASFFFSSLKKRMQRNVFTQEISRNSIAHSQHPPCTLHTLNYNMHIYSNNLRVSQTSAHLTATLTRQKPHSMHVNLLNCRLPLDLLFGTGSSLERRLMTKRLQQRKPLMKICVLFPHSIGYQQDLHPFLGCCPEMNPLATLFGITFLLLLQIFPSPSFPLRTFRDIPRRLENGSLRCLTSFLCQRLSLLFVRLITCSRTRF